jgi:hypothetical protein
MLRNMKPGVGWFSTELFWNPFNVVFRPTLLTPTGLRYRKRLGMLAAAFALLITGGFIIVETVRRLAP